VLSPCLLWRYRAYLYGQALRAAGRLAAVTGLATTRLVVALGAFYLTTHAFGLWGAVGTVAVLSVVTGAAYEWTYHHPGTPPHSAPAPTPVLRHDAPLPSCD
jgi:hypothetical protein